MKRIGIIGGFLLLFVGIIVTLSNQFSQKADQMAEFNTTPTIQLAQGNNEITQIPQNDDMKKPKMSIDKTKKYTAIMKTTAGDIEIELFADKTPITVNNFVSLSKKKFYGNVIFHRTIKGFMIQAGDPTGTGRGGPGYTLPAEIELPHKRGSIAMARLGDEVNPKKDSSGSQFYIAHQDIPQLDGQYTVFGQVTKGLDTVDKIAEAPTKQEGEGSTPVDPVKIESVTITEE